MADGILKYEFHLKKIELPYVLDGKEQKAGVK